ncbi:MULTISPECIES: type II secretion system protein GspL [unclassified Pseudomonas]|uniref:type II secretion system protein GspL n=1 Tax=unclassified Pseudomonas TaxID=196821 RepID=UPI000DAA5C95|nr:MULTISPECIES: type II secretion system protein GspL [unclassified Pseudomonas]MDW3715728.1 type II secretion system protein GspL [Pseudomonas sp. 2023EL-01195]PZE11691.1 type II secretion system protein GspL [Pseudomonas sp. 57B-090624]
MSASLRIALPPLAGLHPEAEVEYAWLDRQGHLASEGRASLAELGRQARGKAVELTLHPDDSLLASLELPPLPAARLGDAVRCAADGLVLGGCEGLQLVHGPRQADGRVQLAWLERERLQRLLQGLRQCALEPRGLYGAPFFLNVDAGAACAQLRDGQLLVRENVQGGWVHPLPEDCLPRLLESGEAPRWPGDVPEGLPGEAVAASRRWTGPAPACNLLQGLEGPARGPRRWGRALACCALAVGVWTLGLNLHATQMAHQGLALKQQMSQRVKQVFPQLPVVLNPLQQARQQRDARLAGGTQDGPGRFAALVQQAVGAMPFALGAIESIDYDGETLRLTPRAGARKPPADPAWQASLAQAGLQAAIGADGWSLKPLPPGDAPSGEAGRDE